MKFQRVEVIRRLTVQLSIHRHSIAAGIFLSSIMSGKAAITMDKDVRILTWLT
ncbi:MAG: hypothetical protein LBF80_05715 [Spirochaetaceae bacterium]|nr:hypothetical protein [Spirochaetaceae bacterium]